MADATALPPGAAVDGCIKGKTQFLHRCGVTVAATYTQRSPSGRSPSVRVHALAWTHAAAGLALQQVPPSLTGELFARLYHGQGSWETEGL